MKSRTAELRARLVQLIAELPDSNSEETDSDDCPSQVLTYGSFFSGMECPLTALEIVANTSCMNRVLKPQFACDINKHCRDVLSKHFRMVSCCRTSRDATLKVISRQLTSFGLLRLARTFLATAKGKVVQPVEVASSDSIAVT